MTTAIGLLLIGLVVACVAGYLRATFSKPPRPGTRRLDPAGGYATADQLREQLSADAVRRAGAHVRPSLPQPRIEQNIKRKGLLRGRR